METIVSCTQAITDLRALVKAKLLLLLLTVFFYSAASFTSE